MRRRTDDPGGAPPSAVLLKSGDAAFARMLEAIAGAQHAIRLEVYIFRLDPVGERFVAELSAAARRGVRVEVVLDGFGSRRDSAEIIAALEDAGCVARIYHPFLSLFAGRFRRSHRKLLLVDDETAFIGGFNISEEYGHVAAGAASDRGAAPPARLWLDLAVEVRGAPAAWVARRLRGERVPPPRCGVQINLSGLGGGWHLRHHYVRAIRAARHEVLVAHGYFIPDQRLVRALTAAAHRGVSVSLLLAGQTDLPLHRPATMRLYVEFLRAGVHIREWTHSVHHAKVMVVDGQRLLVGSFNLEPYSMANLEALVEVNDPGVARDARAWVLERASQSHEVTLQSVAGRSRLQLWILDAAGLFVARVLALVGRLLALR